MPISLAQPAPAGAFNDIVNQGNLPAYLSAYTSMQNALQSRYASDLHTRNQAALGYAQLDQDAALRREALGLQAAEMQQRPGLIELQAQAHARASMDQWMMQQQFTARDQQELNRQQNSLGELLSKRESGEISDEEFYHMAGDVAPRVNALQAKQQYTQQKAMEEERKARAARFKSDKERLDLLNSLQSGELESQIDQYVLPEHKQFMADYMKRMYPELQAGTPEYDGRLKLEASQMGATMDMVKVPGKGLVPLASVKAMMGGTVGGTTGGVTGEAGSKEAARSADLETKQTDSVFWKARAEARAMLAKKDALGNVVPPDPAAVKALAEELMRDNRGFHGQQKEEKSGNSAAKVYQSAIAANQERMDQVQANTNMPVEVRQKVVSNMAEINDLMQQFPPGGKLKMPQAVEAKIRRLKGEVDRISQIQFGQSAQAGK